MGVYAFGGDLSLSLLQTGVNVDAIPQEVNRKIFVQSDTATSSSRPKSYISSYGVTNSFTASIGL